MPYTFRRTKKGIRATPKGGGKSVLFHTRSMAEAHRRAGMREAAKHGKLRVAKRRRR